MKLKSKYATLAALIVLTAMPHALDQLSDLKNIAQERFRAELLNIFWSFTTPETRRTANQNPALQLARAPSGERRCNGANELNMARSGHVAGSSARAMPPASALGHRQPLIADEPAPEDQIASAGAVADEGEYAFEIGEHTSFATPQALRLDQPKRVALISSNLKSDARFDEAFLPQPSDDAVAQLALMQGAEDETAQPPAVRQGALPKRALPAAQRFAQKFVQKSFQIQVPENLERTLSERAINSDTFIKALDVLMPVKTKCRVRVMRIVPEAPRVPDKPATIS